MVSRMQNISGSETANINVLPGGLLAQTAKAVQDIYRGNSKLNLEGLLNDTPGRGEKRPQ
jgi:hypothetical protein